MIFFDHPVLWTLCRKIDERIEPLLINRNKDDAVFLRKLKNTGLKSISSCFEQQFFISAASTLAGINPTII